MLGLNIGLILLLLGLQYPLWLGDGSFRTIWKQRVFLAQERKTQESLKVRNLSLEAEVQDLKGGLEALEERARQELGLIKPGETFYQWVDNATDLAQQ